MACNSLSAFLYDCSNSKALGGIADLHMVKIQDVESVTYSEVDSTASVVLVEDAEFVKIGLPKNAGLTISEEYSLAENAIYAWNQTLTLSVTGNNAKVKKLIDDLTNQPVIAVVKTEDGYSVVYGLDGRLEVSTATNTIDDATNGWSVVLTGKAKKSAPAASAALLALLA